MSEAKDGAAGGAVTVGWRSVLLVLAVCVPVYWLWLGVEPFRSSEGHRVGPAWEMLASGDWWGQRLFERTYVRKPPGMSWAIAASSAVLGETEFAARAPSALAATVAALAALWYGTRWFGRAGGAAAGLAQALTPLLWAGGGAGGMGGPGRSAEIEMVAIAGAQMAALAVVGLGIGARGWSAQALAACAIAAGLVVTAAAKGPACLPVVVGALVGVCAALGGATGGWWRPLTRWGLWLGVLVAGAAVWVLWVRFARANGDPLAVRQEMSEFLWGGEVTVAKVLQVVTAAPLALAAALPASLMLLFPWGADARREGEGGGDFQRAYVAARALAIAWGAAALLWLAAGVENPRYLMGGVVLLTPLAGYVIRGLRGHAAEGSGALARIGGAESERGFTERRREIGRMCLLEFGRAAERPTKYPVRWVVILVMATVLGPVVGRWEWPRLRQGTGLSAGRAIAELIGQAESEGARQVVVWADGVVEARPDVLLYAERAWERDGLRVVWAKWDMERGEVPARGYLLLRTDEASDEWVRYAGAREQGELVEVGRVKFGGTRYEAAVCWVRGD